MAKETVKKTSKKTPSVMAEDKKAIKETNAENAKEHRIRLMQTTSVEEIKDIINEIL